MTVVGKHLFGIRARSTCGDKSRRISVEVYVSYSDGDPAPSKVEVSASGPPESTHLRDARDRCCKAPSGCAAGGVWCDHGTGIGVGENFQPPRVVFPLAYFPSDASIFQENFQKNHGKFYR